jgi:hypothetical protein
MAVGKDRRAMVGQAVLMAEETAVIVMPSLICHKIPLTAAGPQQVASGVRTRCPPAMVTVETAPGQGRHQEEESWVAKTINLSNQHRCQNLCFLETILLKYIVFIKNDRSKLIAKAFPKESLTSAFAYEMKQNGFRKHFVEVDAESEKEAISKLNEHNEGYLHSLKDLSGSAVICAISAIAIALIYWFSS